MKKYFVFLYICVLNFTWAKNLTPDDALARLKRGNLSYHNAYDEEVISRPIATILTCSDPRVEPEKLFSVSQGDLFVIKNAGNILDDVVRDSIYYGVVALKTPLIVVLGHEDCGAVKYSLNVLLGKEKANKDLQAIYSRIFPAIEPIRKLEVRNEKILLDKAISRNAVYQEKKVLSSLQVVKKGVANGELKVLAGIYQVKDGSIDWIDP